LKRKIKKMYDEKSRKKSIGKKLFDRTFFLFFFAFGGGFFSSFSSLSASVCPYPKEKPVVQAVLQAVEPVYYNHLSSKDFQAFAQQNRVQFYPNNPELYRATENLRGLTLSRLEEKTSLRTTLIPVKGGFCLYPSVLKLTVGFDKMLVLIDSAYLPYSCPYTAVINHENEHVKVNYNTLRFYLPFIRDAYEKALLKIEPIFFATPLQEKTATDYILKFLKEQTRPVFDFFNQVQKSENQKLDTRESYLKTRLLCPDSDW
jgi:hypothetical protein